MNALLKEYIHRLLEADDGWGEDEVVELGPGHGSVSPENIYILDIVENDNDYFEYKMHVVDVFNSRQVKPCPGAKDRIRYNDVK